MEYQGEVYEFNFTLPSQVQISSHWLVINGELQPRLFSGLWTNIWECGHLPSQNVSNTRDLRDIHFNIKALVDCPPHLGVFTLMSCRKEMTSGRARAGCQQIPPILWRLTVTGCQLVTQQLEIFISYRSQLGRLDQSWPGYTEINQLAQVGRSQLTNIELIFISTQTFAFTVTSCSNPLPRECYLVTKLRKFRNKNSLQTWRVYWCY